MGVGSAVATGPGDRIGVSGTDLQTDEIGRSANVKHLANIAPSGALAEGLGTDMAFQTARPSSATTTGSRSSTSATPGSRRPSSVSCPGSQNDISVSGDLLYLSTDSSRSDDSCASTSQSATQKESWEGIKIFDISDVKNPKYVKSVETACGSHTHTLVPGKGKTKGNDYLYVSSYSPRAGTRTARRRTT